MFSMGGETLIPTTVQIKEANIFNIAANYPVQGPHCKQIVVLNTRILIPLSDRF